MNIKNWLSFDYFKNNCFLLLFLNLASLLFLLSHKWSIPWTILIVLWSSKNLNSLILANIPVLDLPEYKILEFGINAGFVVFYQILGETVNGLLSVSLSIQSYKINSPQAKFGTKFFSSQLLGRNFFTWFVNSLPTCTFAFISPL